MDDTRRTRVLAAWFRTIGRLDPRADATSPPVLGAEAAREALARLPSLAHLAAAVSQATADVARAADVRLLVEVGPTGQADPAAAVRFRALMDDLQRVPDGPPDAVIACLVAVATVHLARAVLPGRAPARLVDLARVAAALEAAGDGPLLLVSGRITGLHRHVFGSAADRVVPADSEALAGRSYRAAQLEGAIRRRLLAAAATDEHAVLQQGGGRFLFAVAAGEERRRALAAARGALEADLLALHEGALGLVVAFVPAAPDELADGAVLLERLAAADRARAATPFVDALEQDGAFGPFGHGATDEASLRAAFAEDRALGQTLRGTRFAVEVEAWPPRLVPVADDAALAAAVAERPDGLVRVEWPGGRDGLRALLGVAARAGGRLVPEPSPALPVQRDAAAAGPFAAVHAEVERPAEAAPARGLLEAFATARIVDDLVRAGAAGIAQGRLVAVLAGAGERVVACGPLRAVLLFVHRLAGRLADELDEEAAVLSAGVAVTRPRAGGEPDVARLARAARVARAGVGPGETAVLGAAVASLELGALLAAGDALAQLCVTDPGAVRALHEAALRVGTGGEPLPLSAVERLRGKIHEIAGRLATEADGAAADPRSPGLHAVRALVRDFGSTFGSGVARVPLAYAVLLAETNERKLAP